MTLQTLDFWVSFPCDDPLMSVVSPSPSLTLFLCLPPIHWRFLRLGLFFLVTLGSSLSHSAHTPCMSPLLNHYLEADVLNSLFPGLAPELQPHMLSPMFSRHITLGTSKLKLFLFPLSPLPHPSLNTLPGTPDFCSSLSLPLHPRHQSDLLTPGSLNDSCSPGPLFEF